MELQIKRRRRGWLGHTLRKLNTSTYMHHQAGLKLEVTEEAEEKEPEEQLATVNGGGDEGSRIQETKRDGEG